MGNLCMRGEPFDFVDLMFSNIQKTRTDTRKVDTVCPFIMLLINRATNGELVHEGGAFRFCRLDVLKHTENPH
jgi:hypothetical protein